MIEAVKIWNEPNNKSHWDPLLDPEWARFAEMTRLAGAAVRAENPTVTRVLGGMSPIDPSFVRRLEEMGVMGAIDVIDGGGLRRGHGRSWGGRNRWCPSPAAAAGFGQIPATESSPCSRKK